MRNISTRRPARLALACALALGAFSTAADAQIRSDEKALVVDARGAPVMSGFGQCVRSSFGPPPEHTAACHGAAPAPVALNAAPAPEAAPAPLPVYEKVAFDANVLFDSDKSALRPAGRDTLDEFVARIHGLDSQNIMLVGYADRMGTHADNQTLSQDRVDTVKAYLVGKGIVAERVQTSARGETQPTTPAGECTDADKRTNVACMQPDRHVFIEVSGTRIAK